MLDMERCIIRDLELWLWPFSIHFHMTSELIQELECLLSLALVAHQYMYVRPMLTKYDVLEILKKHTHFLLGIMPSPSRKPLQALIT